MQDHKDNFYSDIFLAFMGDKLFCSNINKSNFL